MIDPYDERTAKMHVRKVQELVSNTHLIPTILGSIKKNYYLVFLE